MNRQHRSRPSAIRTAKDDLAAWQAHWQKQNQPWRTEPEIGVERQRELERRGGLMFKTSDVISSFKRAKLSRADVEWLLATHDGAGPVDWKDESQQRRRGLDLRAVDLRNADLHALPLARLYGGLTTDEGKELTEEQRARVALNLAGADLRETLLQGANLRMVNLQGAHLSRAELASADLTRGMLTGADLREAQCKDALLFRAQLASADLRGARLEGANLRGAYLKGANLGEANLEGADLREAQLEEANLRGAHLKGADLRGAQFKGAYLRGAYLERAYLLDARLEDADLFGAWLVEANLSRAQLDGANLRRAELKNANASRAQLNNTDLAEASLEGADFSGAQLAGAKLDNVVLVGPSGVGPRLADVQWGNANLAVVNWSQISLLGDEWAARKKISVHDNEGQPHNSTLRTYQTAVRANRQLAVALQSQGLNEEAVFFAYRARVLLRKVLWYQALADSWRRREPGERVLPAKQVALGVLRGMEKFGSYLFQLFLDVLAGYGYKPGRTLGWYLLVIASFALAYFLTDHATPSHLSFVGALILSITAFHGRGFFPGDSSYTDSVTIFAAIEAVVGLLIELSFIATFTQRFFGK